MLVEELLKTGCHVNLVISETGKDVLMHETGIDLQGNEKEAGKKAKRYFKKEISCCLTTATSLPLYPAAHIRPKG